MAIMKGKARRVDAPQDALTQLAMNMTGRRESTNIEDRRGQPPAVDPSKTRSNTMFAPFQYDENGDPLPDDNGKPPILRGKPRK